MSVIQERVEIDLGKIVEAYVRRVSEALDDEMLRRLEDELGLVKVVRCRDCKHYEKDPAPVDPGWPMMCADSGRDMLGPDGYCAWGVRKEDA